MFGGKPLLSSSFVFQHGQVDERTHVVDSPVGVRRMKVAPPLEVDS